MDEKTHKKIIQLFRKDVVNSDYIKEEYKQFAISRALDRIPNLHDGLITSQRQILYTAIKIPTYSKTKQTVVKLAADTRSNTIYDHGEQNLYNAIKNIVIKPYSLLDGFGTFPTKTNPNGSEPRYINIKVNKQIKDYFFPNIENSKLIKHYTNDGQILDPIEYYPAIPLLLVYGQHQIGVGFMNMVLPRNINDIIDRLEKLNRYGTNIELEKMPFYIHNFKGTIVKTDNDDKPSQWTVKGNYEWKVKYKTLIIKDWGIKRSIYKYLEHLVQLKNDSIITKIENLSKRNDIHIEITFSLKYSNKLKQIQDDKELDNTIISILKLSEKISDVIVVQKISYPNTEIKNTSDLKYSIIKYKDEISYIKDWYTHHIDIIKKRINWYINYYNDMLNYHKSIITILISQITGTINIGKMKTIKDLHNLLDNWNITTNDIKKSVQNNLNKNIINKNDADTFIKMIEFLNKHNYIVQKIFKDKKTGYSYIENIKLINMTQDNIKKFIKKIEEIKQALEYYKNCTPEEEYQKDLDNIKKYLKIAK